MVTIRETALLRQQATLANFGEFALRANDLDKVLYEACRLLGDALHTDLAKVMELQEDGITLLVRAGVGWPPGVVGKATARAERGSSEGYALQTGNPAASSNIDTEDRFTYADFVRQAGVKALVNVLIIGAEDKPAYGILQVDSRHPREFTEADIDFLRTYANLLAAAVNRLRVAEEQLRAHKALARAGEELERRVAERTAELDQALTTLRRESRDREQAEDRLRQGENLKAIGQLTGGIAHDFNNMLQAITGCLSTIRSRVQQGRTAEVVAHVERAEGAAKRAADLTHRLLAFGRRQTLVPKPVSMDRIAKDMEDMIRRTVGPAVQVELKLADGKWSVMCDPSQLESALLNLCVNARDAMPQGGWLTVSTAELVLADGEVSDFEDAKPGRYAAIAVSDTGTGMTREVVAHAFEPFFTTKPPGQGTGLGLSQIYGFVRQSGGIVQVETAPGKGTTVRLCLPFYSDSGADDGVPVQDRGKTLLLIDDEAIVREVLAEHLRDCGYRVLEADSGPAALRVIQTGARIDVLISDVGLPGGMDGRQVAEVALKRQPDLPVILITGYAFGEPIRGMEVIRKPFLPEILADAVRIKLGD
jgi:signal transduction histidine kinase